MLDSISKYDEIRKAFPDPAQREWIFRNSSTKYNIYRKGDVLFNQGKDQADRYFFVIKGRVAVVKTITDHDMLYRIKQSRRLQKCIEQGDGTLTFVSSDVPESPQN